MGQFTHELGIGEKPHPPKTLDKVSREEAILGIESVKRYFSMHADNIYHLNGNITIHMKGSYGGIPVCYNGEFLNTVLI